MIFNIMNKDNTLLAVSIDGVGFFDRLKIAIAILFDEDTSVGAENTSVNYTDFFLDVMNLKERKND